MAVKLEDTLLVLLGGRPASTYELWHWHRRIFGSTWSLDISRVMTAVANLERSRLLHVEQGPRSRMTSATRFARRLTPAGRQQLEQWLCTVTPDLEIADIYIRGLLAVEAADGPTFEAFLASSLAATRQRMSCLDAFAEGGASAMARSAFDLESARALERWLQLLPRYRSDEPTGDGAHTVPTAEAAPLAASGFATGAFDVTLEDGEQPPQRRRQEQRSEGQRDQGGGDDRFGGRGVGGGQAR